MLENKLDAIFYPGSVAVVGASENTQGWGFSYLKFLIDYGYQGSIYPINPDSSKILGLPVYPDLASVPGSIDYVICCLGLPLVPNLLAECSQKGVKGVHLLATGGSETRRKDAVDLDKEILARARGYGIRLVGPNCLGIYSPEVGLSCGYDYPKSRGPVSALIQSGGNSINLIRWGAQRGLRFSKVASYGNALDVNETDLLTYYAEDNNTKVILCYLEGVADGRAFVGALRHAASRKPVIVVRSGKTKSGARAVAGHTGALAGSAHVWQGAMRQAGAISVANIEEMIDLAVAFCFLPPISGTRVALEGAGGGEGALACDECESMGLDVIPVPRETIEEAREIDANYCEFVGNPLDPSVLHGSPLLFNALSLMAKHPDFDLVLSVVVESAPLSKPGLISMAKGQWEVQKRIHDEGLKPIAVVVRDGSPGIGDFDHWRWKLAAESRTNLINAGIPFYSSIGQAAKAMREFTAYWRRKQEG